MKSKFLLCLLLVITITSFKKYQKNENPDYRLKKNISLIKPSDSITYSYTPDGKIAEYHEGRMRSIYSYIGNKVIEDRRIVNSSSTYIYYLNQNGRADSLIAVEDDSVRFRIRYVYDNNDYIIGWLSGKSSNNFDLKMEIENGNVVKEIYYNKGKESAVSYMEYYPNIPNQPCRLHTASLGYTFMGADSKNLLKQRIQVRNSTDTVSINLHHYTFDDKGRIKFDAIYNKYGILVDSVEHFY